MFICSMRMTKRKAAAAVCVLAVLLGGPSLWAAFQPKEAVSSPSAVQGEEKRQEVGSLQVKKPSYAAKDNGERIAFLGQFGYETLSEPDQVVEVLIPFTFDAAYERYNQLQQEQGLDLLRYKGKRAKRYTYTVTNYPPQGLEEGEKVVANLLVVGGKVIGGDLSSTREEGFTHGFVRQPSAQPQQPEKTAKAGREQ